MDTTSDLYSLISTGKLMLIFCVGFSLAIAVETIINLVFISLLELSSLHIMDPWCLTVLVSSIVCLIILNGPHSLVHYSPASFFFLCYFAFHTILKVSLILWSGLGVLLLLQPEGQSANFKLHRGRPPINIDVL